MTVNTVYVVQAFTQRGRKLAAEPPVSCKTEEEAIRKAERMAPLRTGVIVFRQDVDEETGEVEDGAKVLFRSGELPQSMQEE